ncbi:MAG: hypothetical protein SF339_17720 [Blastocatellia bacterium]|nr:hypothetical protein [Blastocatellia bacterium]
MKIFRHRVIRSGPASLTSCAFLAAVFSVWPALLMAMDDPFRFRPGLRNSPGARKLNARQLEAVAKSLREKTGFRELAFDEAGFLTLGDRTWHVGGSALARKMVAMAVDMAQAVDLEALNHSPEISFARMANQVSLENRTTHQRIESCSVQIDFTDFGHLQGDRRALAAFDLGFVLLHELGHAVMGLHDSFNEAEGPGQCEEHINAIRRELKLPVRQTYLARVRYVSLLKTSPSQGQAELLFAEEDGNAPAGRAERPSLLRWAADRVGPIVNPATIVQTATPRSQTAAAP